VQAPTIAKGGQLWATRHPSSPIRDMSCGEWRLGYPLPLPPKFLVFIRLRGICAQAIECVGVTVKIFISKNLSGTAEDVFHTLSSKDGDKAGAPAADAPGWGRFRLHPTIARGRQLWATLERRVPRRWLDAEHASLMDKGLRGRESRKIGVSILRR